MTDKPKQKTVVTVVSKISDKPIALPACFVVIYGLELGKKYNLDAPQHIIGRSSKAEIQVDQEAVSRNHAKVLNTGKSIILRDLGSTNGTFVNDELIDEYVLKDGDLVKIGRTVFKFLSGNHIESAYHEEIYRLTTIDGLTQIHNKRYFVETLERELSRALRYRRELSLVMFDIDHFKQVNDRYGHIAGDHVLKQLAQVIKSRIRREDVLARFGGEEFATLLPEIDHWGGQQFGEKIRRIIEKTTFKFEETKIPLTISVGVGTLSAETSDAEKLLKWVDGKLYEAKAAGRNKVAG